MICGIYLITNKISGKCYVGQSINIEKRLGDHKNKKTEKQYIDKAINKHGADAFKYDILLVCTRERLNYYEIACIAEYNSFGPEGYNLTEGGYSAPTSDETKAKISEAKKGKPSPHKGKTLPLETKAKISEALKGKTLSTETKAKISESMKMYKQSITSCLLES